MSTQTSTTDVVIPSGQEIYDTLMAPIEPELVSNVLPTLKEKYKNETSQERKARKKRYDEAFAKYDEACTKYMAKLEAKIDHNHKVAMQSLEEKNKANEKRRLAEIERNFSSTA